MPLQPLVERVLRRDGDVGRPGSVERVEAALGLDEGEERLELCPAVTGGSPLTRTCSNSGAASLTGLAASMPTLGCPSPVVLIVAAGRTGECAGSARVRSGRRGPRRRRDVDLGEWAEGRRPAALPASIRSAIWLGAGRQVPPRPARMSKSASFIHASWRCSSAWASLGERAHPVLQLFASARARAPDRLERLVLGELCVLPAPRLSAVASVSHRSANSCGVG